ncbi:sensor histidine kinase [Actinacidiphila oryziradicis]|uniref:histidine kinase n=1 Tax=Actinacidiphila oryziradicis TaxID=2571141 RepID=A0A4U0RXY9_9ACTN|nr:histidine kinase dimerization/phospho-acceptor domain-containing protein [Actinacidiphila oryziradicis]TKA01210.1 sensor histidine kinase KdpD [Actinacidiphila oryziradicis]
MERGQLRIYLGAAPGVGKTFAMLAEGRRRAERGTDVAVGFVETYGRPRTAALLEGLEIIPRRSVPYRGTSFTELDADAVIARRPQVALIDELAHTNVPGSPRTKRWQDVERILDAGIAVLSTVNIQHLDSVNDVVRQITGVPQRETVPDEIVRRADQVELVDITPEALRRRMAHGNIYTADKVDAALTHYFRVGNLTALRELALLWLADKVDDQLESYRADHQIAGTWEARERVVVALTGGPEGDTLIRRASRIAERTRGADLLAVHVTRDDALAGADSDHLAGQRVLVECLGGTYHQVVGDDIPTALLDFARAVNATQVVLGASRRGRLGQVFSRGVGLTTTARSGPIDVHLVTHEQAGRGRRAAGGRDVMKRRGRGHAVPDTVMLSALAGGVLRGERTLDALLEQLRETFGLASVTLLEHRPGAPLTPDRQRDPRSWRIAASVGAEPCASPDEGDVDIPVGDGLTLILRGRTLPAADRRVLEAFAVQAAIALRLRRLEEEVERLRPVAEADRARAALLGAVSHDLRIPLASAEAAVDSLADANAEQTGDDHAQLVATARDSLAHLDRLVGTLLDVSRVQAGTLGIDAQPLAVEDIIPTALEGLAASGQPVDIRVPDGIPEVLTDPTLAERILVNLISNAQHHNPPGRHVLLTASTHADRVELRVMGHGPATVDGDTGLGLTLARALADAMGATLMPEETPGGGLTMTLSLPAVAPATTPLDDTGDETAHPAVINRVADWRTRR